MSSPKIKFVNTRPEFYSTLRSRVDQYFIDNNITKYANSAMVVKTIVMFAMYVVPYSLIMTNSFNGSQMMGLLFIMALGTAGIGLSVMHDANHGSYSPKKWINNILGETLTFIGGNSYTWKIQHNVLHHTYTNIFGHDQDIDSRFILCFSEHANRKWYHKFQHIYALPLYSLMTISFLAKDFRQLIEFNRGGYYVQNNSTAGFETFRLIFSKVLYFCYTLVLPILFLDVAWWQVILGFIFVHIITGSILSVIFQLAHVMEDTSQPLADENGNIENSWAIHQLNTTCNFAPNNKLLTWYVGGLNFQVEHHLFPLICHIHYPQISKIVKSTAREFGIPYYEYESFTNACLSHINTLKKIGEGVKTPELTFA